MDKKERMKKVLNYIIEKKDFEAKAELQKILHEDKRYIDYKNLLKKYGFIFEKIDVPEEVYIDLQEVLKPYHKDASLKIIDELYMIVAKSA